MCTNKFSIGELIGVHVSSIVNEIIRAITSQFFVVVFLRKNFERKKHITSQNQLRKQN